MAMFVINDPAYSSKAAFAPEGQSAERLDEIPTREGVPGRGKAGARGRTAPGGFLRPRRHAGREGWRRFAPGGRSWRAVRAAPRPWVARAQRGAPEAKSGRLLCNLAGFSPVFGTGPHFPLAWPGLGAYNKRTIVLTAPPRPGGAAGAGRGRAPGPPEAHRGRPPGGKGEGCRESI